MTDRDLNQLASQLAKHGSVVLTKGEQSLLNRINRRSGEFAPPKQDHRVRGLRGLFKGGR